MRDRVTGRNGSAIVVGVGDNEIGLEGKNCSGIIVRDGNDDSEIGENNGLAAVATSSALAVAETIDRP
ncbi:MAG: hypothetical protein RBJ76_08145 [Stenomitos frigidus ULC029]